MSALTCTTDELSMPISIGHIDPNCFEAIAWYRFSSKNLDRQKSATFGIRLLSRNIFVGLRSKWTMQLLQRWCKSSQIPWLFDSTFSMQIHTSFVWTWRLHLGWHSNKRICLTWKNFCCIFMSFLVCRHNFLLFSFIVQPLGGTSHAYVYWTTSLQLSHAQWFLNVRSALK